MNYCHWRIFNIEEIPVEIYSGGSGWDFSVVLYRIECSNELWFYAGSILHIIWRHFFFTAFNWSLPNGNKVQNTRITNKEQRFFFRSFLLSICLNHFAQIIAAQIYFNLKLSNSKYIHQMLIMFTRGRVKWNLQFMSINCDLITVLNRSLWMISWVVLFCFLCSYLKMSNRSKSHCSLWLWSNIRRHYMPLIKMR